MRAYRKLTQVFGIKLIREKKKITGTKLHCVDSVDMEVEIQTTYWQMTMRLHERNDGSVTNELRSCKQAKRQRGMAVGVGAFLLSLLWMVIRSRTRRDAGM